MTKAKAALWAVAVAALGFSAPSLAAAKPPKLVVLVVVDQLSDQTLEKVRPHLGKDGILKLLVEGKSFTNARYGQAATYTGPGHACLSSGSYPHVNGIVSNKFYDREKGKSFTTLFDAAHPLLEAPADPEDDSSPVGFTAQTLGDALRGKNPASKVVAVALKDRASVLLAGHGGAAYWLAEATGKMTSSTFYMEKLPAWVAAFNAKTPADAYFGKVWERALPVEKYAGPDDPPYEADYKGLGKAFPHKVTGKLEKPGPDYYLAFGASPFSLEWQLSFVEAALDAEKLGADAVTDLLAVSFTTPDYVGHAYGPDSQEVQDIVVRLDRAVAQLISKVEKKVGKKNVVFAFTADHGAASAPEKLAAEGKKVRRIKKAELKAAVQAGLTKAFGPGEWLLALEDPSLYLNLKLAAEKKVDPALLEQAALEAALGVNGIAAGFTRTQLLKDGGGEAPYAKAVALSFHPNRAGDVLLVPAEQCFWGKYGERDEGSTHGSPHAYDSHVPLAFYGAGVTSGVHGEPVDMSGVAATLAALAGLPPLANAEGQPLPVAPSPAPKKGRAP